jgi:hypothetical protein
MSLRLNLGLWGGGVKAWSPLRLSPLQYLTDSTLIDKTSNGLDATYVESPLCTFAGGETMVVTELKGLKMLLVMQQLLLWVETEPIG